MLVIWMEREQSAMLRRASKGPQRPQPQQSCALAFFLLSQLHECSRPLDINPPILSLWGLISRSCRHHAALHHLLPTTPAPVHNLQQSWRPHAWKRRKIDTVSELQTLRRQVCWAWLCCAFHRSGVDQASGKHFLDMAPESAQSPLRTSVRKQELATTCCDFVDLRLHPFNVDD